jgi:ABC-type phosphate/phosphonate transport system permease subunit
MINKLSTLIQDKVNIPLLRLLNSFYTKLFYFPRPLGIPILMVVVGLLTTISVVLWCVIFSAFLSAPLAIFKAASVYEFTIYTITAWIEFFRLALGG